MYYLARNKEVVLKARRLFHPERETKVGNTSSSGVSFTTLGSFPSQVLEREIFVGIKEYQQSGERKTMRRAPLELATITAIAEHIPELRDDLPDIYALLRGTKGRPIGILMEDFSEGDRHQVNQIKDFHPSITSLFDGDVLDSDRTCYMGFWVTERIRYADFFPIFRYKKEAEALARFPMRQAIGQVTRYMWQHTLRLGKDL